MAPKKGGKRKAEWGDPEATPPVKARRQVVVFQAESEDDSVLRMWDGLDPRDDNSVSSFLLMLNMRLPQTFNFSEWQRRQESAAQKETFFNRNSYGHSTDPAPWTLCFPRGVSLALVSAMEGFTSAAHSNPTILSAALCRQGQAASLLSQLEELQPLSVAVSRDPSGTKGSKKGGKEVPQQDLVVNPHAWTPFEDNCCLGAEHLEASSLGCSVQPDGQRVLPQRAGRPGGRSIEVVTPEEKMLGWFATLADDLEERQGEQEEFVRAQAKMDEAQGRGEDEDGGEEGGDLGRGEDEGDAGGEGGAEDGEAGGKGSEGKKGARGRKRRGSTGSRRGKRKGGGRKGSRRSAAQEEEDAEGEGEGGGEEEGGGDAGSSDKANEEQGEKCRAVGAEGEEPEASEAKPTAADREAKRGGTGEGEAKGGGAGEGELKDGKPEGRGKDEDGPKETEGGKPEAHKDDLAREGEGGTKSAGEGEKDGGDNPKGKAKEGGEQKEGEDSEQRHSADATKARVQPDVELSDPNPQAKGAFLLIWHTTGLASRDLALRKKLGLQASQPATDGGDEPGSDTPSTQRRLLETSLMFQILKRLALQHHDLWGNLMRAVFACTDLVLPPQGMRLHGLPALPSDIAKTLMSFLTCALEVSHLLEEGGAFRYQRNQRLLIEDDIITLWKGSQASDYQRNFFFQMLPDTRVKFLLVSRILTAIGPQMVVRPLMVQGTSLQLEGVLKALGSPKAVPLVRSHGVLKADLMALMLIHLTRAGLANTDGLAPESKGLGALLHQACLLPDKLGRVDEDLSKGLKCLEALARVLG